MRGVIVIVAALAALGGCATAPKPRASVQLETLPPAEQAWHGAIAPADAALIDNLPAIWSRVLVSAKRWSGGAVADEGALLDPDGALDHPELPPGSYRCRVVRIGKGAGHRRFVAFPPYFCYVKAEDQGLSFAKQTGSDLPSGSTSAENTAIRRSPSTVGRMSWAMPAGAATFGRLSAM